MGQITAGGAKELVMDTELVAVDRADNNRLKAFQELSTRARGMTEMHQVGPSPICEDQIFGTHLTPKP